MAKNSLIRQPNRIIFANDSVKDVTGKYIMANGNVFVGKFDRYFTFVKGDADVATTVGRYIGQCAYIRTKKGYYHMAVGEGKLILSNGNEVKIKYVHNQKSLECSIKPVETSSKEYKLGLWVRDSAAGVGTVTFYEPLLQSFGALGHGITDIDTEQLIDIASGEFVTTKILNVIKGERGFHSFAYNGNNSNSVY